jgi:hypothetical protein
MNILPNESAVMFRHWIEGGNLMIQSITKFGNRWGNPMVHRAATDNDRATYSTRPPWKGYAGTLAQPEQGPDSFPT